ncbi:hypothetical protein [Neobacillus vireti]|uniref:Uncharacterized protein n=1 Tax=Neobacillus vireti LMG 21834 TaxID=1131730 RepID=A0AB94IUL3_9BACI|nr:hypothetical protein [Neobacillus vireti]ETI70784.1 hypothetical protein BAVI_00235 [Neobacillus vireti LMG 21834]KLT17677.1 hypothetical protein AA980_11200 [Neobacillus vireti]
MDPITVIEIIVSTVIIIILFSAALLVPQKVRKQSLLLASILSLIIGLFFAIRPIWINFQVKEKTAQLNQYLKQKYPNEEWEIKRKIGRQYNPYHLDVRFDNEKGWVYTYFVNDHTIFQIAWSVPDNQSSNEGKHYELEK